MAAATAHVGPVGADQRKLKGEGEGEGEGRDLNTHKAFENSWNLLISQKRPV